MRTTRLLIAAVGTAAVVFPTTALPASALPKPPVQGTVSCDMAGTITINKPGIPATGNIPDATEKPMKFKVKATATDCVSPDLVNSKWPITEAQVTVTGTIDEGASCWDLPFPPDFTGLEKTKVSVKWFGTNAVGKRVGLPATNGVLVYDSFDFYDDNDRFRGWELGSDTIPERKPFQDQYISLQMALENYSAVFGDCYFGTTPMTELSFSAAAGSKLIVQP